MPSCMEPFFLRERVMIPVGFPAETGLFSISGFIPQDKDPDAPGPEKL